MAFNWFKKKPEPPAKQEGDSSYELASRIASTLDAFIDVEGLKHFETNTGLTLFVTDSAITISASPAAVTAKIRIAIPLHQIEVNRFGVEAGGLLRHRAVDMAAIDIFRRIVASEQSRG